MSIFNPNITVENLSYKCFDLMSNEFLGTLPLTGVKFGQRLNVAGSFGGDLPLDDPEITDLHPLAATQPGRTLLVVDLYNPTEFSTGQILWAGIIWTRQYSRSTHKLTVGGLEAWSYFSHRLQAEDYSLEWSTTPESSLIIAQQVVNDAITKPYSAFADMAIVFDENDDTPVGPPSPITVSYPLSQYQTVDNIIQNLVGMGYSVGFDFAIDWAYDGFGKPQPTLTLSYPRRGQSYDPTVSQALDTSPAFEYTYPEDSTKQANQLVLSATTSTQGTATSEVTDIRSLSQGYPLLESVVNYPQVNTIDQLRALAAGELALSSPAAAQGERVSITSPVVDVDPFGNFPIGSFLTGDDVRWIIPQQTSVPPVDDERFPGGGVGNF